MKVAASCGAAPDSARRAGNFHLLAQMKVTKAKGLNTDLVEVLGLELERSLQHRRTPAGFLVDSSSRCDFIGRKSPLGGPCRSSARLGRAARLQVLAVERSKFEPQEIRPRPAASKSARKRFDQLGGTKPGALSK